MGWKAERSARAAGAALERHQRLVYTPMAGLAASPALTSPTAQQQLWVSPSASERLSPSDGAAAGMASLARALRIKNIALELELSRHSLFLYFSTHLFYYYFLRFSV